MKMELRMEIIKPWEIEWTEEKIKDYFDRYPFVTIARMVQLTGMDKEEIMEILMEENLYGKNKLYTFN